MAFSLFNGSCSTITIPCEDGMMYIDPCSCVHFYICASRQTIVQQRCPLGTEFNQSACGRTDEVKCNVQEPWQRCRNVEGSKSKEELRNQCLNASSSSSSSSLSSSSSEGGNGGAIAGAVIAVLLVAVIVVGVVLYVRKRGNPIRHLKVPSLWRRKTSETVIRENKNVTSPVAHVSAAPSEEEVYACIDDAAMCRDEDLVTSTPPRARPNVSPNQNTYTVVAAGGTGGGNRKDVAHFTPAIAGPSIQIEVTTDEPCPSNSPLEDQIDHSRDLWRAEGAGERPAENILLDPQQYLVPRPITLGVGTGEGGATIDPPYYELENGGHEDPIYANDVDN